MNKYLSTLNSQFLARRSFSEGGSPHKGFTLVELLVVFAIFFVVTAIGMVSFSNFSKTQLLESSSQTMITFLNSAKSYAVSQTIPPTTSPPCDSPSPTLKRISVKIVPPDKYEMWVYCNIGNTAGSSLAKREQLSKGITFNAAVEVPFKVSDGTSADSTIVLKDSNNSKTISIDAFGNISAL